MSERVAGEVLPVRATGSVVRGPRFGGVLGGSGLGLSGRARRQVQRVTENSVVRGAEAGGAGYVGNRAREAWDDFIGGALRSGREIVWPEAVRTLEAVPESMSEVVELMELRREGVRVIGAALLYELVGG